MRTFDETSEEKSKKASERTDRIATGGSPDVRRPDFDLVTRPIPEGLIEDSQRSRDKRREEYGDNILNTIVSSIGTNFESISEEIQELDDVDLGGLGQAELLQVIAQTLRTMLKTTTALAENDVQKTTLLEGIRESVETSYQIVVSGVNSIDTPNAPQPVVPDSDDRDFPIRTLYMRADPSNSRSIYIGDDAVAPSAGFVLRPGEWITVEIDYRDTELYMASVERGAEVGIMGMF